MRKHAQRMRKNMQECNKKLLKLTLFMQVPLKKILFLPKSILCWGLRRVSLNTLMSYDILMRLRTSRCLSISSCPFLKAACILRLLLFFKQHFAKNEQLVATIEPHTESLRFLILLSLSRMHVRAAGCSRNLDWMRSRSARAFAFKFESAFSYMTFISSLTLLSLPRLDFGDVLESNLKLCFKIDRAYTAGA